MNKLDQYPAHKIVEETYANCHSFNKADFKYFFGNRADNGVKLSDLIIEFQALLQRQQEDKSLIRELVPLAEQGLRMLVSDMANLSLTINQRVTLGLLYKQAETVIQKANERLKGGVE